MSANDNSGDPLLPGQVTARPNLEIVDPGPPASAPPLASPAAQALQPGPELRAEPAEDTGRPRATLARKASPGRIRGFARRILMLGGLLAVIFLSAFFWLRGGRIVVADNAYIRAAKLMVSTDVSGIVSSIEVGQGQAVKEGQVLFRLDPKQFEIALDAARARLTRARQDVVASQQDYARIHADIGGQQALVAAAQVVFDRADALVKRRAGSQAAYDQARYNLEAARKRFQSLQHQAKVALTRLGGNEKSPPETNPQWLEAKARVAEAERQLARTVVRAPFAGTVTAVESLQPGTFLVAQTAALTSTGAVGLVATQDMWIEANIKETDLTHVRPGNPVDVTIDTYPGRHWRASVKTIFPATGSEFSILPAQNASGNWVKVVQRISVRLGLERKADDPPLRAGMSVVVRIDTGHTRSMRDLWRLVGLKSDPLPSLSVWADDLLKRE